MNKIANIRHFRVSLVQGEYCGILFEEMSKAYYHVQHETILDDLHKIGRDGTVLQWFGNYLSNRQQRVVLSQVEIGNCGPCSVGVPQGLVLGPLLFCKVPNILHETFSQLYADDICFSIMPRNLAEIRDNLNANLARLDDFLSSRGLLLNPEKTQFIVIYKGNSQSAQVHLQCRSQPINFSSTTKYHDL